MSRIGLLHPGAMGASIGAQLTSKTHTVLWWPEGEASAVPSVLNKPG